MDVHGGSDGDREGLAGLRCGWCGEFVAVPLRGRRPKWCSSSCRHRAWEQRRAAESGLAAVEIVDRVVETVVKRVALERVIRSPRGAEWAETLLDLAKQLDAGRLYDRDIDNVALAADAVFDALDRRLRHRSRPR